jgi:hypothetical protein
LPSNVQTTSGGLFYEVTISTEAPESASLSEGSPVSVTITVDQRRDVLVVPVTVVYGSGQMPQVEVAKGGDPAQVSITLGLRDKHLVEVKEGLHEGDVIRVRRGTGRALSKG